jgi:hypothetical protein
VVFVIIVTCGNVLQFWICGWSFRFFNSSKGFGRRTADEPSQLREASQILNELIAGKRGGVLKVVIIIVAFTVVIPHYLLRDRLVPARCNGNVAVSPSFADVLFLKSRLLSGNGNGNATTATNLSPCESL